MFEYLHKLRPDLEEIFSRLNPVNKEDLLKLIREYPDCPYEYFKFIEELGWGYLTYEGEPFYFEEKLISAEREYYKDKEIYKNGAYGDILIFGWENMGTAYGFDTGLNWQLVEVDEFRIVSKLSLSFIQFVVGLLICYPQIPTKYEDKTWYDGVGDSYK
jgi:hypothetical protein